MRLLRLFKFMRVLNPEGAHMKPTTVVPEGETGMNIARNAALWAGCGLGRST